MSEKNIYKIKNSYRIAKSINGENRMFGVYSTLDDAVYIRNLLIENNWDMKCIDGAYKKDDYYLVLKVIGDRLHLLAKFKKKPTKNQIEKLVKKQITNPNNSRYGLNITRVFDVYIIKKQIAGDEYIFGYYDNLEDAEFVRNFLLENNWNVNSFGNVEKDTETNKYKCIGVIDDKVCVLDTFNLKNEAIANYDISYKEFISKIYKNKHGLARYSHLDAFKEIDFDIAVDDENWDLEKLENGENPKDLIFNLTPWQKIILDNIKTDSFTFDDLIMWLKRYKSKNFENKVRKYLDELIKLNFIEDLGDDSYQKMK